MFLAFTQHGDGAFEIAGVPKDDRGHDEVEARRAMLLVFVSAVAADFAEPVDETEHGARETVARLAFVELLTGPAPEYRVVDPVESEERAFQPPQFAKRGGDAVLSRV